MKKRTGIAAVIALFAVLLLPVSSVFGISNPNSVELRHVKVFRSIFEENDWLITAHYNLDYGGNDPDEIASDVYAFYLYDGITPLGSRDLNYYGNNLISIWFSADDVASKALSWSANYTAKIQSKVPYDLTWIAQSLSSSSYISGTSSQARSALGVWILTRMGIIEDEEDIALTVSTTVGTLLNTSGTVIATDAIPGITSVLDIFQYGKVELEVTPDEHTRAYQETLSGFTDITLAESTSNWSGTSLNATWDRVEGRYAVQNVVSSPTIANTYSTIYDPSGTWDFSAGDEIVFSIKSSRYSENFTSARFYVTDNTSAYIYWDLDLNAGVWTLVATDNMTGEGGSGGFDSSVTDNISWSFVAADTTGFHGIIDNVYVATVGAGIGAATARAFGGFGDWLGVSATFVASAFFIMVYLVSASVIYFVMGSGMGALAVAIPIVMLAGYPFGVIPLAAMFVITIVLSAMLGYLIYLRGL